MIDALFQPSALWFSIPALLGTAVFVLRLATMLLGGDADGDAAGHDAGGGEHLDSGHSFEILSVQSIAAFLMGFGWAGLGSLHGAGWSVTTSILCGGAGGILMAWLLGFLLQAMYSLEASGNISIELALGAEGEVYASVPPRGAGRGQVRVVLAGRQRIFNAVSEDDALPSQTRVRVVRVNPDHTLTVVSL